MITNVIDVQLNMCDKVKVDTNTRNEIDILLGDELFINMDQDKAKYLAFQILQKLGLDVLVGKYNKDKKYEFDADLYKTVTDIRRKELEFSLNDIAEIAGLSISTITKQRMNIKSPGIDSFLAVANALQVSPNEFLKACIKECK